LWRLRRDAGGAISDGIWDIQRQHIAQLKRIVEFIHSQVRRGIQLAHAGRKASMSVPFGGERLLKPEEGGGRRLGRALWRFRRLTRCRRR